MCGVWHEPFNEPLETIPKQSPTPVHEPVAQTGESLFGAVPSFPSRSPFEAAPTGAARGTSSANAHPPSPTADSALNSSRRNRYCDAARQNDRDRRPGPPRPRRQSPEDRPGCGKKTPNPRPPWPSENCAPDSFSRLPSKSSYGANLPDHQCKTLRVPISTTSRLAWSSLALKTWDATDRGCHSTSHASTVQHIPRQADMHAEHRFPPRGPGKISFRTIAQTCHLFISHTTSSRHEESH